MTFIAVARRDDRLAWRVGVALGALVVAALIVFGLGELLHGALPAAPRNPFGVGIREAAQSGSGLGGWLLARQAWFDQRVMAALREASEHGGLAPALIGLSFAYGVFHAGGPGHGKTVISAYIIANEAALRRGVALAAAAALTQAFVAIVIVLAATYLLHLTAYGMTALNGRVELLAFAAIALYGLALTWRKAAPVAKRLAWASAMREAPLLPHDHRTGHDHVGHDHAHGDDHGHHPHGHHDHDACCQHVPLELVQARDFRWRDAVSVVLAAGLRPCSGAVLVLIFALSQHLALAGIAAVLAMAAGVAVTVGALAAASVYARRAAMRFARGEGRFAGAGAAIELLAAAFVAVLGMGLLGSLPMMGAG
jgi:ABC-type nickel/cobalt efflux system permease component RcnA